MNVEHMLEAKGHDVLTIPPSAPVTNAAEMLTEKGIGALVVSESGDTLTGILSERDIVRGLTEHGPGLLTMPVSVIMSTDVRTCAPDDSNREVMAMMTEFRIRHMPVLKDEKLFGIISIGDVVKNRLDEILNESELLRNYVMGIGQG